MVYLGTSEMATPNVTECLDEQSVSLAEALAGEKDLEPIKAAMIREYSIRTAMAETGEDRQTIVDMMGAGESMDQEAVLELTSGAPTTLADGLQAYIEGLELGDSDIRSSVVIDDLHALLTYPWPEEEATISTHGENASVGLRVEVGEDRTTVYVGGSQVVVVTEDDLSEAGPSLIERTVEEVHRAVLARVIGDRPHHVQLSGQDAKRLYDWLGSDGRGGSWSSQHDVTGARERLTMDAVQGGGVLIRTHPYKYVVPPLSRTFAQDA